MSKLRETLKEQNVTTHADVYLLRDTTINQFVLYYKVKQELKKAVFGKYENAKTTAEKLAKKTGRTYEVVIVH